MNTIVIILISVMSCSLIIGQVPIAEIEGRLSIYNTEADSSSLSIGRNAGLKASFRGTSVGVDAGTHNVTGNNSFFGYRAGHNNAAIPLTQLPDAASNSFFGAFAGEMNLLGGENSFFGAHAGKKSQAYGNSFFGAHAGANMTHAFNNSFFGTRAGRHSKGIAIHPETGDTLIAGSNNTFFGHSAGLNNETGEQNVFIGSQSGQNNDGGDFFDFGEGIQFIKGGTNNVFMGYKSGHQNTTGNMNIYVGTESGGSNDEQSHNIYIGHYADNLIGSQNIVLGPGPYIAPGASNIEENFRLYIGSYESQYPLIYGEFDNQLFRITGELEVEDASLFMRNLGNNDTEQGVKWGESNDDEAFGMVYDGVGSTIDNRLHIREYVTGGPGTLMTIKANGNVGFGREEPLSTIDMEGLLHLRPRLQQSGECDSRAEIGRVMYNQTTNKLQVCTDNDQTVAGIQPGWVALH